MAIIEAGNQFEDFTLNNHKEVAVNTADLQKKKLLLSFHPLAWTPVCTKQMQSLDANYDLFQKLNTAPLGIFIDQFGFSQRANIILDEQRKVVFVKIYPIKELPDINEILDFLKRKSQT